MVWGAPGSVPGYRGEKWDRSQIWALRAYMVPSSSVFMGNLQTLTPTPENAAFLFLALKELELGGLTVSYLITKS